MLMTQINGIVLCPHAVVYRTPGCAFCYIDQCGIIFNSLWDIGGRFNEGIPLILLGANFPAGIVFTFIRQFVFLSATKQKITRSVYLCGIVCLVKYCEMARYWKGFLQTNIESLPCHKRMRQLY